MKNETIRLHFLLKYMHDVNLEYMYMQDDILKLVVKCFWRFDFILFPEKGINGRLRFAVTFENRGLSC